MAKKPKAAKPASTETSEEPTEKKAVRPARKPKSTARNSSKQFRLLEMLHRPEGATLEQLMTATSWQQHSVRGFLSGTVKKKLGLKLLSEKTKNSIRIYRVKAK
jgi:hypothetical protein